MAYGFLVNNGSNEAIINQNDSGRIMYQLVASGTTGTTGGGSSNNYHSVNVSTGVNSETLVFARCNTNNVSWVGFPGSSGFTLYSSSSGVTFSYLVMKQAENLSFPAAGTYGLLVRDEDNLGNPIVVYSSESETTRIKGTITSAGTVNGSNLYGLLVWHYSAITARVAPQYGDIRMPTYKNTSTGITFQTSDVFQGYQVTDPEDVITSRWINPTSPKGIVIQGTS